MRRTLYDALYCARAARWRTAQEAQLGLFADRTRPLLRGQPVRLLLASFAYILMERLRNLALAGTEFARLQASTLRVKLLKIGVVILRNTRRVRVLLSSAYPLPVDLRARAARPRFHLSHTPECCPPAR